MTIRTPILTLVVTGLAWAAPAAQAHLLAGDDAVTSKSSVSAKSALSVMTVAGIRYHAQANYANEKRLFGRPASTGVRPDDRSGVRGI
jgi:ethanolamine ammonia-lyase large subunit